MVDYQKLRNCDFLWKKLWKYTKIIAVFEQIYSFRTLIYYGTMEKAMILLKKTMVIWKKLWCYGKKI